MVGQLGTVIVAVAVAGALLSLIQAGLDAGYPVPEDDPRSIEQFEGNRAIGFSEHPNTWAAFLLLPLGFSLAAWIKRGGWQLPIGIAAAVVGIILSESRSGWLAALVVFPALLLARGRRAQRFVAGGLVVAVTAAGLLVAFGGFVDSDRLSRDESAEFRLALNRSELELGARYPVAGIGLGNVGSEVAKLSADYLTDDAGRRVVPPHAFADRHNVYLGLFAELGLLGLVLFVALLGAGVASLLRSRRLAEGEAERAVLDGLLAALLATAVVAAFTEADRQVFLWWILGLAFGLELVLRRSGAPERTPSRAA